MDKLIKGNVAEQNLFSELRRHYDMAREDLDQRRKDWDKKDELFRSHIEEAGWPYQAMVFDPRVFTAIYEKTARLLANKPQGRLIPREGGDALGAKINNELLMYQWDDNERVEATPMLAKWALMDLNARKYGSSFGLCKWRWERQLIRDTSSPDKEEVKKTKSVIFYDGPDFKALNNRDCLPNPSYSTVKKWFQYREYLTLAELEDVNDAARSKPVYKNLDLLKQSLKETSDSRQNNYSIRNLTIKNLTDYLGKDPSNKIIEIVTEYRPDKWITFAPNHGVVLREIPNPYDHQQIPIIQLKYYPIDEDLYGLSEIEPVEKIQKAINALLNQYLDAINMSLYAPLKINQTGGAVQLHTLEFGPGQKWLMNDPSKDVLAHDSSPTGVTEFASTYRFLVGAMQEALGETSATTSNLDPGQGNKTATEIKDLAVSRSARDNFNLVYLGEALKKQMMFWHKMNQQFLFSNKSDQQKIIQVTGKDAIKFFQERGLDGYGFDQQAIDTLGNPDLAGSVKPEDLQKPIYPIKVGGDVVPKMTMDGGLAHLVIEKDDLSGNYDYIPDIGSMNTLASSEEITAMREAVQMATGVDPKTGQPTGLGAMMRAEGKQLKATDIWVDLAEKTGFKDAEKYVGEVQQQPQIGGVGNVQANPTGGSGFNQMQPGMGNMPDQGMAGGNNAMAFGQA